MQLLVSCYLDNLSPLANCWRGIELSASTCDSVFESISLSAWASASSAHSIPLDACQICPWWMSRQRVPHLCAPLPLCTTLSSFSPPFSPASPKPTVDLAMRLPCTFPTRDISISSCRLVIWAEVCSASPYRGAGCGVPRKVNLFICGIFKNNYLKRAGAPDEPIKGGIDFLTRYEGGGRLLCIIILHSLQILYDMSAAREPERVIILIILWKYENPYGVPNTQISSASVSLPFPYNNYEYFKP